MDLLRLAWRNLGRNWRRTIATGTALAFGMSLCIASFAIVDGLNAQMLHSLTRLDIGHGQIHARGFVPQRKLDQRIAEPAKLMAKVDGVGGVQASTARVFAYALLTVQGRSSGIELVGIDPAREPSVTELHKQMRDGAFLPEAPTPWPKRQELSAKEKALDDQLTQQAEDDALAEIDALDDTAPAPSASAAVEAADAPPTPKPPADPKAATRELALKLQPRPKAPLPIIIGASLAKVLDVKVGDEVYASVAAVDGMAESVFLKVHGIYKAGSPQHDRHRGYLHLADARRVAHLGNTAHEIALRFDEAKLAAQRAEAVNAAVANEALLVRDWGRVRPDVQKMLQLNDVSTAIMVFIIFFVAALGVVNTMLMSVFERTRELGVLKAIGMSARRVMALIVGETLLLVLAASAVGAALGLGLDLYLVKVGLDLSGDTEGMSIAGLGIDPVIHGKITAKGVLVPVAILAGVCLLASIYPAVRAARLQPAVGMRET